MSSTTDTDKNSKSEEEDDSSFKVVKDKAWIERAKRWVILVDDEEPIRTAVGQFLFDQGYQVTACADADALFEVVYEKKQEDGRNDNDEPSELVQEEEENSLPSIPDIIISDVRMPGQKYGLELVSMIRADERLSRVPVVLLTAKAMTRDRIAGYKAGADVYLPKPFNPDELLTIIDNAIVRRAQMTGRNGKLVDLKQDMSDIKKILKRNGKNVVKKSNVYLTPSEREVMELLCEGFTNGEIAEKRDVSITGVNRSIQNLYLKTLTKTRTELLRWALETGQIAK